MISFIKIYSPLIPIIGLALYILVYTVASLSYPGGSINLPNDIGYSFFHNFLCDLMNPFIPNGSVNPARPLAIVSHLILSFSMISFFYILPEIFNIKNRNTKLIQSFGMISMTILIFMYTSHHDLMVILTAIFGTLALVPFFIELYNYPIKPFKTLALLCYLLSIIVFISYVSKIGFYYLPFLQKITFGFDTWWVYWVCLIVYNKRRLGA